MSMEKDIEKDMTETNTSETVSEEMEGAAPGDGEGACQCGEGEEACQCGAECEEGCTCSTDDISGPEKPAKESKRFKKNKDKEKITELEDRVMRQMAEFENFRRRTEKEKQSMFETGAKSVIEKILPIIDNFERGLSTVSEAEKETGFANGMNMIYKQLLTELENIGVKPIAAVGQEFDPNLHNAVMQVASEEYESGVVAQELMKGYTYRDTVVRYSMVAVAE